MSQIEKYNEYLERFEKLNTQAIVDMFNKEVGVEGWTSSRATYLAAIHGEFERRGIDYSVIGNKEGMSLKDRVVYSQVFNRLALA